jgi:small subunit ribosomal protein S18
MSEDVNQPQKTEAAVSAEDRGSRPAPVRADKDAFGEGGPKAKGKRRRKVSYLTINKIDKVDFREINILRRFLNDRGKILPARQSGNTAKQQRMIASAIRKAREMALLPFVIAEMGTDRREQGLRRDRGPREYTPRNQDGAPRESAPSAAAPAAAPTAEAAE